MDTKTLEQEILSEVRKLDFEMQSHLLQIVKGLTNTNRIIGEPGWRMVQHARELNFPKEDLAEMEAAIEEWCERVDDFPEVNLDG